MGKATASAIWRSVFTRKHLKQLFYDRIKNGSAVGLDWTTAEHFEKELDNQIEIIIKNAMRGLTSLLGTEKYYYQKGQANLQGAYPSQLYEIS